jgi:hypothetical protein
MKAETWISTLLRQFHRHSHKPVRTHTWPQIPADRPDNAQLKNLGLHRDDLLIVSFLSGGGRLLVTLDFVAIVDQSIQWSCAWRHVESVKANFFPEGVRYEDLAVSDQWIEILVEDGIRMSVAVEPGAVNGLCAVFTRLVGTAS